MRLIEIHEQAWFPGFLRDYVTEALQFILSRAGVYGNSVGRLQNAFTACDTTQIVDLCSGGQGPWLWMRGSFTNGEHPLRILLTDKYPNLTAVRGDGEAIGNVTYLRDPVDARNVPVSLHGFRTIFSSFHHFREDEARSIFQDAVRQREGIGIFEAARYSGWTMLSTVLMLLGAFASAPFIRPFRIARLFWTYILPVVPFVLFFDGIVSCIRAYTPGQLAAMTSSLHAERYTWDIGEERHGIYTVTYVVGYPT